MQHVHVGGDEEARGQVHGGVRRGRGGDEEEERGGRGGMHEEGGGAREARGQSDLSVRTRHLDIDVELDEGGHQTATGDVVVLKETIQVPPRGGAEEPPPRLHVVSTSPAARDQQAHDLRKPHPCGITACSRIAPQDRLRTSSPRHHLRHYRMLTCRADPVVGATRGVRRRGKEARKVTMGSW